MSFKRSIVFIISFKLDEKTKSNFALLGLKDVLLKYLLLYLLDYL